MKNKIITDIEQSMALSKILPKSTADVAWDRVAIAGDALDIPYESQFAINLSGEPSRIYTAYLPAWTAQGLLDALPSSFENEEGDTYSIFINKVGEDKRSILAGYENNNDPDYIAFYLEAADNLIDALYNLAIEMSERGYLPKVEEETIELEVKPLKTAD